jgi:DNA-dependent RNA polymerase auxiliary subunit epsilon
MLCADLFEPRKDAPEDVPRRETAIYLYGVDVMSSSDVLSYFDEYGPSLVEWINDSSCEYVRQPAGHVYLPCIYAARAQALLPSQCLQLSC